MPAWCRPAALAGLALLPLLAAAQIGGPVPRPTQDWYEVELTVTDTAGAPIAEADVRLTQAAPIERNPRRRIPPITQPYKTGQNGKRSIALMEGYWRMSVQREGYVDADSPLHVEHLETVRAEEGKTARLLVQLLKAAALEGTVYLEDGRRVALAKVRLQPAALAAGPERRRGPAWLVQNTDKDGHYRFPVVPPGDYGMWITPPHAMVQSSLKRLENGDWIGYAGTLWHPSVEEVRNIVPVTLDPGVDLHGIDPVLRAVKVHFLKGSVYDQSTRLPLTHALVALRTAGAAPVEVLAPQPVNGKTAHFEFPPLPEDDYDLLVYRNEPGMNLPWPVHFSLEGGRLRSDSTFVPGTESSGAESADARLPRVDESPEAGLGVLVPDWTPWTARVSFRQSAEQAKTAIPDLLNLTLTEVRLIPLALPEFEPVVPSFDPRKPQVEDGGQRTSYALETTALPPISYRLEVEPVEGWYLDSITSGSYDYLRHEEAATGIVLTPSAAGIEIGLQRGGAVIEGQIANQKGELLANSAMCAASKEAWRRAQPGGAFCVRADSDGKFRSRWLAPGGWSLWAFPKKPAERPGSEAFEKLYGSATRLLEVHSAAETIRLTLLAAQ